MTDIDLWILASGALASSIGLTGAVALDRRARRVLGAPVHKNPGSRAHHRLLLALAFGLAILGLQHELRLALPCAILLVASGALLLLTPPVRGGVCGDRGLRSGWEARAFAELAEWRLTGDHLRYRITEEWRAVDLPRALHAALRARLAQVCPERESVYRR